MIEAGTQTSDNTQYFHQVIEIPRRLITQDAQTLTVRAPKPIFKQPKALLPYAPILQIQRYSV